MEPKLHILKVSKSEAASRQIEAAISAFEEGDYDIAITLSGAAEGMLPEQPAQALFAMMRDHPGVPDTISKKGWVAALNAERDWLKHQTDWMGRDIEISPPDAAFMILRALAKLPNWTSKMGEFKNWALLHGLEFEIGPSSDKT